MGKSIFLIDDDLGLQMVLEMALRDAGYEVELANDGLEAVARLRSLNPNLVLSDIMMPQLDGVQLFHSIKEQLQDNGIPIIIMTALNRKAWFTDLEAEGAVFIQKPFEVNRLLDLIRLLLDE